MSIRRYPVIASVLLSLVLVGAARAEVAVDPLFGTHMVLQRDIALPVWGTAKPDEQVTVTLSDRKASVKADSSGKWQVRLEALPAGGPFEMTVSGDNKITITDVLVGEVWICSGQSNMALPVQRAMNSKEEVAAADYPKIRLLKVARRPADEPSPFAGKQWQVCSPETVPEVSTVGYFFGRDLHKTLNVPVGLIDSSVGGTPAESWTPRPALEADPAFQPIFERWNTRIANARAAEKNATTTKPAGNKNAAKKAAGAGGAVAQPASRPGRAAAKPAPRLAEVLKSSQRPAVLYNGMIHPLVPYAIRGVVWYQGEANGKYAYLYRKLFPTMINSWRKAWGEGEFPFLFVQLAGWEHGQSEPYQSDWAELREAQTMTLSLPKTGMAVITDVSEAKNIHPVNKQEVGRRLALAARAIVYGEKIPYSGPMYDSMAVDGDKIRVRFKHTDGGLAVRGGEPLKGFAIAGEDQKFVEAQATIDGDTVVVRSDKVAQPAAVRYGWADVPEDNLVNGAGLPASPFRTDDWPGVTRNAK
jgi:sialate O-acetylesterase